MARPTLYNLELLEIKREPRTYDEEQEPRNPTYGPQDRFIEAPKAEEKPEVKQIVYRCPHKRDEGGRCNNKETDFTCDMQSFL